MIRHDLTASELRELIASAPLGRLEFPQGDGSPGPFICHDGTDIVNAGTGRDTPPGPTFCRFMLHLARIKRRRQSGETQRDRWFRRLPERWIERHAERRRGER